MHSWKHANAYCSPCLCAANRAFVSKHYLAPLLVILLLAVPFAVAEAPQDVQPSRYAPIDDLAAQVEMFVEDIEDDLEYEADYDDDHQNRVWLNASTPPRKRGARPRK